jgi:hypothetical protein
VSFQEEVEPNAKVLEFHQPEELHRMIDLKLPEKPMSLNDLLECSKNVLRLGVKTGNPRFFNQMWVAIDNF